MKMLNPKGIQKTRIEKLKLEKLEIEAASKKL